MYLAWVYLGYAFACAVLFAIFVFQTFFSCGGIFEGMSQHFHIWRDKQTIQGLWPNCIWRDKQNQENLGTKDKETKMHITQKLLVGFHPNLHQQTRRVLVHLFVYEVIIVQTQNYVPEQYPFPPQPISS